MTLHSCFQPASLTPHPAALQVVTGSARGRCDGRNSGAAAEAPGMPMVPVKTTRGRWRRSEKSGTLRTTATPRRGASGSRRRSTGSRTQTTAHRQTLRGRCDEELVEVDDAPPEAEPRPLPIARLFGGAGSNASAPPVLNPREWHAASLSVDLEHSNGNETAFRGLRRLWLGHKLQALVYDSCVTQWCYVLFDYAYRDGRPVGTWFIDRPGGSRYRGGRSAPTSDPCIYTDPGWLVQAQHRIEAMVW